MPDIDIVRRSAGGTGPWKTEPERTSGGGSQTIKSYRALITYADLVEGQDHVDLPFTIPADEVVIYSSVTLLEIFNDGSMFDPANLVWGASQVVVGPDVNLLVSPQTADGATEGKSATSYGSGNVGESFLSRYFPVVPGGDPLQFSLAVGGIAGDGTTGQVLVILITVPKAATT